VGGGRWGGIGRDGRAPSAGDGSAPGRRARRGGGPKVRAPTRPGGGAAAGARSASIAASARAARRRHPMVPHTRREAARASGASLRRPAAIRANWPRRGAHWAQFAAFYGACGRLGVGWGASSMAFRPVGPQVGSLTSPINAPNFRPGRAVEMGDLTSDLTSRRGVSSK
jgi:hypothetical protein